MTNIVHPRQAVIHDANTPLRSFNGSGPFSNQSLGLAPQINEPQLRALEQLVKTSKVRKELPQNLPPFAAFCRKDNNLAYYMLALLIKRGDDGFVAQALSTYKAMSSLSYAHSWKLVHAFKDERDIVQVLSASYLAHHIVGKSKRPEVADHAAQMIDNLSKASRYKLLTTTRLRSAFRKAGYGEHVDQWQVEINRENKRLSQRRFYEIQRSKSQMGNQKQGQSVIPAHAPST